MPPARAVNDDLGTALIRRTAIRGILWIAGLTLLCNLAVMASPLFNMQVFNRVLPTRDTGTLGVLAIGLALFMVFYTVLDLLRGLALEALAGQLTRRLSLPLLRAIAADPKIGAPQALADLETLRSFVGSPACTAPFDVMWTPVLLLVLLTQHWAYAALGALCCTILVVMNLLGNALSRTGMLAANQAAAGAVRLAADAVQAAEAAVGLGMVPALSRRWQDGQARRAGHAHQAVLRARAVAAVAGALRMGMTGAMVGLGLVLALHGEASSGSMVAGNMILARLLLPFQQIAATRQRWIDAQAAWRRIAAALETAMPRRYLHAMPAPAPRLAVETLAYYPPGGDRPLLRGVSFTAEPGEAVGVIGPSAAGKSTLVRLVLGMLQPSAGGAYLDGTSTFLWEREDLARHVGYVPQGLALLEETVAENIARLQTPDMPAVLRAAKRAGVHDIVAALPYGYATRLAPGVLSNGQRQRLAMARALYGRPGLLVLDEPSAFLDRDGEAEIVALLASLRAEGTTVLLITHRPALLATVDRLLVLRDGMTAHFGERDQVLKALASPPVQLIRASAAKTAS